MTIKDKTAQRGTWKDFNGLYIIWSSSRRIFMLLKFRLRNCCAVLSQFLVHLVKKFFFYFYCKIYLKTLFRKQKKNNLRNYAMNFNATNINGLVTSVIQWAVALLIELILANHFWVFQNHILQMLPWKSHKISY